jgi:hypothetical protein
MSASGAGNFTPTKSSDGNRGRTSPNGTSVDYPTAARLTERRNVDAEENLPTPDYHQDDTSSSSSESDPPKNRGGRPRKKRRRLELRPLPTHFDKNEIPCSEKVGFMIGFVQGVRFAGGNLSAADFVDLMEVSRSAASRYMNMVPGAHTQALRRKEAGNPEAKARMSQRQEAIAEIMKKDPDASTDEIVTLFEKAHGIKACKSTVFYDKQELGIGKKRRSK